MSLKSAFFAMLRGERSQSELESLRQSIEALDALEAEANAKGAGHHTLVARVFVWHARAFLLLGDHLLQADARSDPNTAGYVPEVTFTEVRELYLQVPPAMSRAKKALQDPHYQPDKSLPSPIKQRGYTEDWPIAYLNGLLQGSQAMWNHLEATYKAPFAEIISMQRQNIQEKLVAQTALGALQSGRGRTQEALDQCCASLWEIIGQLFLLGQLMAMPSLVESSALAGFDVTAQTILFEERWFLSHPEVSKQKQNNAAAEAELKKFWEQKGWRTTRKQERYLTQTKSLLRGGDLEIVGYQPQCPFAPLYRAKKTITILDNVINPGTSFFLLMNENRDALVFPKI
jgi:hypothetical protein